MLKPCESLIYREQYLESTIAPERISAIQKAAHTQVADMFGIILISEIFKRIVFTFKH